MLFENRIHTRQPFEYQTSSALIFIYKAVPYKCKLKTSSSGSNCLQIKSNNRQTSNDERLEALT